ncbi:MAG: iron ABC transporter permease [Acidobacteria bacterium]|nr:iron ABC transporter permease [Acidobacteriota bacterium]
MSSRAALTKGILILGLLLFLSAVAGLWSGAVSLSFADAPGRETARVILLQLRLPRVLLAGLIGVILASSGATFQTLLRNPLADPFILGVSGGAACGAAVATAMGLGGFPGGVEIAAFGGALLATLLVVAIAQRHGAIDSMRLILAGLVLNAFFSATILLSLSMIRGSDLTRAVHWMMGSLSGTTWADVGVVGVAAVISMTVFLLIAGDLRMLSFGEEDARSRGVSTERIKLIGFLTASLAVGAAVSASGIIGFVGLIVPHAVRLIWKRDYRVILPLSALAGGCLVILADLAARRIHAPAELPIGALTALLGVPFFLLLLRRAS